MLVYNLSTRNMCAINCYSLNVVKLPHTLFVWLVVCLFIYLLTWVARWLSGRASGLRSSSRGFEARPRRCGATTLGKLFTPYCLCHQAV